MNLEYYLLFTLPVFILLSYPNYVQDISFYINFFAIQIIFLNLHIINMVYELS